MQTPAVLLLLALLTACNSTRGQLPAPEKSLAGSGPGWNHSIAPDGRAAWLATDDGDASRRERPLVLHVVGHDGAAPRAIELTLRNVGFDAYSHGPVWSPDARRAFVVHCLATSDYESALRLLCVDLVAGEVRELARFEGIVHSLDIDPTGRRLALMDDARLVVTDLAGGVERTLEFPQHPSYSSAASFSPDGGRIAVVTGGGLWLVPADADAEADADAGAAGGDRLPRRCCAIPQDSTWIDRPRWRTDGQSVVVAAGGGVVEASVEHGELHTWTERDLGGDSQAVVFLPDQQVPAAVVRVQHEGGLVSLVLGAGHPKRSWSVHLARLSQEDGGVTWIDGSSQPLAEPGRYRLPYLPGLTELLARR